MPHLPLPPEMKHSPTVSSVTAWVVVIGATAPSAETDGTIGLPATVVPAAAAADAPGACSPSACPNLAKLGSAAEVEVAGPKVYRSMSRRLWRCCPTGRHRRGPAK